jgi:hypothetical protein
VNWTWVVGVPREMGGVPPPCPRVIVVRVSVLAAYWSMQEGMFLKRAHGGLFVGCE